MTEAPALRSRALRLGVASGLPALAMATLLGAAGHFVLFYLPQGRAAAVEHWHRQLETSADNHKAAIDLWLSTGLDNAKVVASSPPVEQLVSGRAGPPALPSPVDVLLTSVVSAHGYRTGWVVDGSSRLVGRTGGLGTLEASCLQAAQSVLSSGVAAAAFHTHGAGHPVVTFATPVPDGGVGAGQARPLGVVVLVDDPSRWLYPFLDRAIPAASSGELLLVQRDGGDALFLNPLRHNPAPPLTVRRSLAHANFAAAAALAGQEGFGAFRDYRDAPVFAATRRIARGDWGLVAKVDAAEVLGPFRARMWRDGLTAGAVLFAVVGLALLARRGQRASHKADLARTEAKLNERFRAAAESLYDVVYEWDLGERIDWLGDVDRLTGYGPGEFPRTLAGWSATLLPEDRAPVLAAVERHLRGEAPYDVEYRVRKKDGTYIWWAARGTALRDARGEAVRWIGAVTDISENKRAEEELRASEERFRDLYENATVGLYRTTPDGRILMANPAAVRMLGYDSLDELASLNLEKERFEPSYPRSEFQARLERDGIVVGLESVWIRRDGSQLSVRESARLVRDEKGAPRYYDGTFEDVSERKQAELQLRKVTEALQQASAAIVITDRDANIEYVNRAFTTFTGYTPEEVYGKNPRLLKSGKTPPQTYRDLWETVTAGETWQGELCNKKKSGELYWEKAVISPVLDAHGEITHFIASKLDVTHSRELEQRLVQAQKMEAIGQLAGGVAHDFNNVLGVITGYAELLARQIGEQHPGRARLVQILKAAQRAAELTRQLLAFSRKQVLQPVLLDLNAVVAAVDDMLRRLIGEDVRLVTRLGPDPLRVKADPGQIEQVIVNLAVNARDAMPEGGTLVLETASADLDAGYAHFHPDAREGRYAVLAVSDTGIGMDAETQSRIFEPFFTTKDLGKGTGLGLSTVYGIVKQSGGHIGVYSEPGRGSTFKVYLPRADEAEVAEPARAPEAPRDLHGTETVLLVEDEEGLREMIGEILEQNGYSVLAADGAEKALAATRAHAGPVHLLLTDVVMPRTSGRAFAESLRSEHPETRVLYMSGYTGEAISHHMVLEPGTPFLQKPFTSGALLRKVREVLEGP